ncbi:MAG: hypothetical protein K2K17_06690 [Lachnospiraceae bacterium]|nr:hypothetical protein [Lachnospiraceae bacterium]
MSVNGVTDSVSSNYSGYTNYNQSTETKTAEKAAADTATSEKEDVGAVYEASKDTATTTASTKKTSKADPALIAKLKADANQRAQQLQSIVEQLMTKQGKTYNKANGLKGLYESLTVDAATKAQAQKDIAEDGYWGVDQTSSRIFDFAMALSGGDPDKMEKMRDAFLKGYKQAEKAWGDALPDISKRTYNAVLDKFDNYKKENSTSDVTESQV